MVIKEEWSLSDFKKRGLSSRSFIRDFFNAQEIFLLPMPEHIASDSRQFNCTTVLRLPSYPCIQFDSEKSQDPALLLPCRLEFRS